MSRTVLAMIVVVALSGVAALMEMRVRHQMQAAAAPAEVVNPESGAAAAPAQPVAAPSRPDRTVVLIG